MYPYVKSLPDIYSSGERLVKNILGQQHDDIALLVNDAYGIESFGLYSIFGEPGGPVLQSALTKQEVHRHRFKSLEVLASEVEQEMKAVTPAGAASGIGTSTLLSLLLAIAQKWLLSKIT